MRESRIVRGRDTPASSRFAARLAVVSSSETVEASDASIVTGIPRRRIGARRTRFGTITRSRETFRSSPMLSGPLGLNSPAGKLGGPAAPRWTGPRTSKTAPEAGGIGPIGGLAGNARWEVQ